jgi:hypothetical protein
MPRAVSRPRTAAAPRAGLPGSPPAAPVAAAALDAGHHARVFHARDLRYHHHAGDFRGGVRHQGHGDGLEVEQQCVGADVVGTAFFAVELAGIVRQRLEHALVEHQVAADVADAEAAYAGRELPEILDDQVRVAAAAHVQLAAQHVAGQGALGQHLGAERERGA